MSTPLFFRFLRDKTGSALPSALALVIILTVLIGIAFALHVAQYRFIRQDVHQAMAQYVAEGGIYMALDSLRQNPFWRARNLPVELPEATSCTLTVAPWGGYLLIQARAGQGKGRYITRALVGEIPPEAFQYAMVLWDNESNLSVTGHTRIQGDLLLGHRGVREESFEGHPFTGSIEGAIYKTPQIQPPYFNPRFLNNTLIHFENLLAIPEEPPASTAEYTPRSRAHHLPSDNPILFFPSDAYITPHDSSLFNQPVTVIATGNLRVMGPLHYEPGTIMTAGGALQLTGQITGQWGLFYGRDSVSVKGQVHTSGQFFSKKRVIVSDSVYLTYPSVIYTAGEQPHTGGAITLKDRVRFDGTLVHPRLINPPALPSGRIVIGPEVLVRGAIYNGLETELHGTLYGSLLTHQLYFYHAPTHYLNWLRNAQILFPQRPIPYLAPLLFEPNPELEVVAWDGYWEFNVVPI